MLRANLEPTDGRQVSDLPPSGIRKAAGPLRHDCAIGGAADGCRGPALISLRGVAKTYPGGTSRVLHGIDLDVARSERLALIGPNGAGKSTLLKCMVGLLAADEGEVGVMGMNPRNPRDAGRMRKRTGFVFQRHCLVNRTSALSNVVNGLLGPTGSWRAVHQAVAPRQWRDRAMAALESVGLKDRAHDRAAELSIGDRKRLELAMALVQQPKLLLLDEPTAGMSPTESGETIELVQHLATERVLTVLFTEHDMRVVFSMSQTVRVMHRGKLIAEGSGEEIRENDLVRKVYLGEVE